MPTLHCRESVIGNDDFAWISLVVLFIGRLFNFELKANFHNAMHEEIKK